MGENPIRFLPPAIILARKHHPRKKASLALAIPFHAALRAHQGVRQGVRHFSAPATLSSAHAQVVAGMRINLGNHMRAQRNSVSRALAEIWSVLLLAFVVAALYFGRSLFIPLTLASSVQSDRLP
jgi:hypothetical protein